MPTMTRKVSCESTIAFLAVQETWRISIIKMIRVLRLSERLLYVTKTILFGLK